MEDFKCKECKDSLEWIGVYARQYKYYCPTCYSVILLPDKNLNDKWVLAAEPVK